MNVARFAPRARRDLLSASRRIAQENPHAAQALGEAIISASRRIDDHPEISVSRPTLTQDPHRFPFLTDFPYVVVYNAAAKPPLILRILHGARDLPELLKDL